MSETVLKKGTPGHGYKYTEISDVNIAIEKMGGSYYQFVEPHENGNDYIVTVKIDKDGNESKPIRGCRIANAVLPGSKNPAQEQGAAITYARRYSLYMAYGFATDDDDAKCLDDAVEVKPNTKPAQKPDTNCARVVRLCKKYDISLKAVEDRFQTTRTTNEKRWGEILEILMAEVEANAGA